MATKKQSGGLFFSPPSEARWNPPTPARKKALLPQSFFSEIRLSQVREIAFESDIRHTPNDNPRGCDGILWIHIFTLN